jgi:prepilin-type processing-associated H-X9-DG protein
MLGGRRGLTAIEWIGLTVLALVAGWFVLNLCFPYGYPRMRPMQATCLAQVKALARALAVYTEANDGRLPLYDNHSAPGYIVTPLGRALKLNHPLIDDAHPSDPRDAPLLRRFDTEKLVCPSDPARGRKLSYTWNGLLLGQPEGRIASPAVKILLIDQCSVTDFVFLSYTAPNYYQSGGARWTPYGGLAEPDNFVHNSGLNCLFVDGHVKWLNASFLEPDLHENVWPVGPTDPHFGWFGVATKPSGVDLINLPK